MRKSDYMVLHRPQLERIPNTPLGVLAKKCLRKYLRGGYETPNWRQSRRDRTARNIGVSGGYRKYRAIRTEVDGITFASKREAARYSELKLLEKAKAIFDLCLQPRYPLEVGDVKICDYVGDFQYKDMETGEWVVEDVKGVKTPVYRLKKKLMKAIHGIEIQEV